MMGESEMVRAAGSTGRFTGLRIGFAAAASHCTLERALGTIASLTSDGADVYPVMNPMISQMTTRFGTGEGWLRSMEEATGHPVWTQIPDVEPVGPKKLLDALVVAPCTGSTLSKLANAQTDMRVGGGHRGDDVGSQLHRDGLRDPPGDGGSRPFARGSRGPWIRPIERDRDAVLRAHEGPQAEIFQEAP